MNNSIAVLIGLIAGYLLFAYEENDELIHGTTGFPKNCRAIIDENIKGVDAEKFSAEDALSSIERNCGKYGYSWDVENPWYIWK